MVIFQDNYLPPKGFFESRQALFESINAYGIGGYVRYMRAQASSVESTGFHAYTYSLYAKASLFFLKTFTRTGA